MCHMTGRSAGPDDDGPGRDRRPARRVRDVRGPDDAAARAGSPHARGGVVPGRRADPAPRSHRFGLLRDHRRRLRGPRRRRAARHPRPGASSSAETYAGKRIFLIGRQNSGFELATGLLPWARQIVLASPSPAKLSVNTNSLAGIRARYLQPYEDHAIGGGVGILTRRSRGSSGPAMRFACTSGGRRTRGRRDRGDLSVHLPAPQRAGRAAADDAAPTAGLRDRGRPKAAGRHPRRPSSRHTNPSTQASGSR